MKNERESVENSFESRRWSASFKSHALKEFDPVIVDLLSEIVKKILSLTDGFGFKETREGID